MTMLEKVARALVEARYPGSMTVSALENGRIILPPDIWSAALVEARAAVEAMRDPTPEMVLIFPHAEGRVTYKGVYSAMIDAALKEK